MNSRGRRTQQRATRRRDPRWYGLTARHWHDLNRQQRRAHIRAANTKEEGRR